MPVLAQPNEGQNNALKLFFSRTNETARPQTRLLFEWWIGESCVIALLKACPASCGTRTGPLFTTRPSNLVKVREKCLGIAW